MYNLVSPAIGPRLRRICCKSMSLEAKVAHWLPVGNKGAPTPKLSDAGVFTDAEVFEHCSANLADLVPVADRSIVLRYVAADAVEIDCQQGGPFLKELQSYGATRRGL